MDVLRRLPCDGTFDQPKPLIRLTGRSIVSSCDLTAATDRWPYQRISQLVESWFGRGIATAAIDTCLVSNSIHILPPWSDKPTVGMYVCGQPLGFYSSGPLFTLSHHMVVWLAANRLYPQRTYSVYRSVGTKSYAFVGQQPTTALYNSSLLVQEGLSFCIEGIIFSQSRMPPLFILFFAKIAKKLVFKFKLVRWLFDFLKTALSAGPIKPHTFVDQLLWYPKCLYTVFRLFLAPPNISHSFSHPFSGFTFLITYFIRNVSSFLLFAAYIDGTSELKSRSALSRSSPSPSLTRLVPTPLSMKNAFRA